MENNTTYTLLIWELIPDDRKLFLIPNDDINPAVRGYLNQAQWLFINSDEMNDGLRFLNSALCDDDESVAEPGFEGYLGVFAGCEVSNEHPLTPITMDGGAITHVYMSGFVL